MRGDPWGNTAHSALRWAYGLLARSESIPNIFGEMSGGGTRVRTEMTMLDHRAQGAIIRGIVHRALVPPDNAENQDAVADAILVAYYLPRPTKEKVAGTQQSEWVDRYAIERRRAIYTVAWWLLGQQGTGTHSIRGMMEMTAQYTLRRGGARRLARLMRKRTEDALQARRRCFELLEGEHQRALYVAESALERAGLVTYEGETMQVG